MTLAERHHGTRTPRQASSAGSTFATCLDRGTDWGVVMEPMRDVAAAFFKACETGQGWAACQQYCLPDATFSAQAEPLAEVTSVEQYTEWMKGLFAVMPDATYDLKSFAVDEERGNVIAYAIFSGTHTGEGGPVAPTNKRTSSDYVYVMDFEQGRISHLTKIWHSGLALQALGWA